MSAGDKIRLVKLESVFDPENAAEDTQALPEADEHVAAVGKNSIKPSNFMNASPFQKRTTKKDPANMAIIGLAALALLATLVAIGMVFTLSPG